MSDSAGAPKLFISYRRDETSWTPPVVVDGEYVYFVDIEGSSHFVARIDHAADEPALECYAPAGGKAAVDAPLFGVTLGRLYVTGLPHEGKTAARRLIVRDDDPSFKPVNDAVSSSSRGTP